MLGCPAHRKGSVIVTCSSEFFLADVPSPPHGPHLGPHLRQLPGLSPASSLSLHPGAKLPPWPQALVQEPTEANVTGLHPPLPQTLLPTAS